MDKNELVELKRKVEQHEKTIVQLMEILAATNRLLSEMKSTAKSPTIHLTTKTLKYPRKVSSPQ
ncbi:hypothetical protein [Paucisalibacillus globulus]|uniref:hypothetical protein n=1 Tax=Paucisalibacillus globulus TaxID=351095 RepID=UPI00040CA246|nr:hypothetical protein [Paucisalibacillus globulus]